MRALLQVVLATSASCEYGFARQLLAEWAGHPANTIIFTERAKVRPALTDGELFHRPECMSTWLSKKH